MAQAATILVADDDPVSLEATARVLREEGYTVVTVSNGGEATEALRGERPAVALLDVMMPGKSGIEVVSEVRRDGSASSSLLVLMSGLRTSGEEQAAGLDAGADGYIARPISNAELRARVRSLVRQHELQEQLRASERRFRELVSRQPDAVLVVDREGTIRFANPGAARLLGRSEEALKGEAFGFPVEGSEATELELWNADGVPRVAEMWVTPTIWDGEDCWVATLHDITRRREADRRIRRQAALLEKARDAILVWELDGTVSYWNPSAEDLYGWIRNEVLGQSMEQLLAVEPDSFRIAREALEREGEWTGELAQLRKDGSPITVDARWTLIRDDDNAPLHVLAIHTDITEKKRLLAQFLRSQRLESIGTLAGGIAHDLNNVLAPILMSVELLKLDTDDPGTLDILTTIEGSSRRGADLVRQVLSFSKGVEGARVPVDLVQILNDLSKVVRDTFPKNITFILDAADDLAEILGDPTQIHQVFLNLAVNARDAMPEGGRLRISAKDVRIGEASSKTSRGGKAPGPYVEVTVTDTGTGMSEEIQAKIFDPFFTTKEVGKGTGLGLSTVAAIVKGHGGHLQLWSQEGAGTSFVILFPATEDPAESVERPPRPDALKRGRGELVLVVDDDSAIRTVTRRTLTAFGYRVLDAADGLEAVQVYGRRGVEIDVVLTDMMMPVMDGPELVRTLRRMNPRVRVIATSGLASEGGLDRARGLAVEYALPKPFTARELLDVVHQVLVTDPAATP